MTDKYQDRYLDHQESKKRVLDGDFSSGNKKKITDSFSMIVNRRRSIRAFTSKVIDGKTLQKIIEDINNVPSSCNRRAVKMKIISDAHRKEDLDLILRGGNMWLRKADSVILFFADMSAYKSPNEVMFMPYLDAGMMMMTACYSAESQGVGSCIVNPNMSQGGELIFREEFNRRGYKLCGAVVLGYSGIKTKPHKNHIKEIFYEDRNNRKV